MSDSEFNFYYTDRQGVRWKLVNVRRSFMPSFVEAEREKDGKTITVNRRSVEISKEIEV